MGKKNKKKQAPTPFRVPAGYITVTRCVWCSWCQLQPLQVSCLRSRFEWSAVPDKLSRELLHQSRVFSLNWWFRCFDGLMVKGWFPPKILNKNRHSREKLRGFYPHFDSLASCASSQWTASDSFPEIAHRLLSHSDMTQCSCGDVAAQKSLNPYECACLFSGTPIKWCFSRCGVPLKTILEITPMS